MAIFMMKKIITLLFIFLCVGFVKAQQSAEVTYKVHSIDNPEQYRQMRQQFGEDSYNRTLKKHQRIYAIAKDLDFVLKFNPNESLYYCDEDMPDETINIYYSIMAKILGSGMSIKYQNRKDSLLMVQGKSPGSNKLYRETSSLYKYKWQITNETNTIMGYPVIKAVSKNVEVWFAPDIPVPFGPAGYGGLPGLILKKRFIKQFPAYELVATEIHFYKKPIKIKKPEKGVLRTEEEGRTSRIKAMNR